MGEADTPPPFMHDVKLVIPKPREGEEPIQTQPFPIFLPHVWFSHYFSNNKTKFEALFMGNHITETSRSAFWNELAARDDPRLRDHPMTKVLGWDKLFIPLSLHGDGVPVLQVGKANTKSVDVLSMSSLFSCESSSVMSQMLLAMAFAMNMDDDTETRI